MELAKIEVKLLECLVALVEESSVTRAGERLGLSQPRMSNALRTLREISGDPLLVRAGQRLVPTDHAIEIANRVRQGLDEIAAALFGIQSFDPASSRRSFVVMMSDYTANLLLPDVFQRIEATAPGIQISMMKMNHHDLQQYLDDGFCDLAIGYLQNLKPNLRITRCFEENAACIAAYDFPLSDGVLGMEEFMAARHVCIGDTASSTSTIDVLCDRTLHAMGQRRSIAVRAPTLSAAARIVANTKLLCVLPQRLAQDYTKYLPLRCLPVPFALPPFDFTMVWHERWQKDAGHVWLRDIFREVTLPLRAPN